MFDINYLFGFEPCQVVADLTIEDEIERLVSKTIETFGKLDILVNVAGILAVSALTDENYFNVFNEVKAVNLEAVLHIIQCSIPHLKQTKGTIINIGSVSHNKPVHISSNTQSFELFITSNLGQTVHCIHNVQGIINSVDKNIIFGIGA